MKKLFIRIQCLLLAAAAAFSMAACTAGGTGSSSASSAATSSAADSTAKTAVTFQDALGRSVTASRPKRVAVLIGSFSEIWCLAGGKDTIVASADDTWTEFNLGLSKQVINIGGVKRPSAEKIISAKPDFVIASANTTEDVALKDTLEKAGINTAYFNVSSFDDYLKMLKICTQITGCTERYTQYGTAVQTRVKAAKARATGKKPTVLYVRVTGSSCKVKSSKDNVLGEMLKELGCVNIADSDKSLLQNLSMESILAADPQYIFLVLQGTNSAAIQKRLQSEILSNPAWQKLTAVKNHKYYYMDQHLYNLKPNERWGEAYEGLAKILYGK
ncbi:MAG: ABC transporter substrate-binding protein [Oscillospiraceae bacterium]|jgi:iron complex transport system substrate-binding protein|nr:ABC transporter substrate-binding protein [Oscillospiraceae bacterium]